MDTIQHFFYMTAVLIVMITKIRGQDMANATSPTCGCCPSSECQKNPVPCSTNLDCSCLFITMSSGGLCADTVISCNDLTPCQSDNRTCTTPNTICVNNTRCKVPVCYPIERASPQRCPPLNSRIISTNPMTTTVAVTITTITTTTTTTTTMSTSTVSLPSQCYNYTTNTDSTRRITYNSSVTCDSSVFGSIGVWIRFLSPAGTTIPTTAPSTYSCGTHAPGWYNGSYPISSGSTINGTICYYWSSNTCIWTNTIGITNCNTFYVFRLIGPPNCHSRYCTT